MSVVTPSDEAGPKESPEEPATGAPGSRRTPSTFASLGHRNFRLLWFGTLVSNSGDWMDQVAFNWLVYTMSNSAIYLALANAARFVPILLFTLVGGVIADRVERRKLLLITQSAAMAMAFILAVLVSFDLARIWMVLLIAAGRGTMNSFNQPARQSLIPDLVPPQDLRNAVALNSATLNMTRVIGPTIGGLLIASVGTAGAFYVNGASFIAVLIALAMMRFPPRTRRPQRDMLSELVGGFTYLRSHRQLRALVVLALVPILLGQPYVTMLPVFARDVLHVGGGGLGLLQSTSAIGAVAGSLTIASLSDRAPLGKIMLVGLAGFGAALTLFAVSSTLWLSLAALIAIGVTRQAYQAANNVLVQTHVDPDYRGRVLSTLTLDRGLVPLGTMTAGIGTALIGVQWTIGLMAATLVLMAVLTLWLARSVRAL